MTGKQRQPYDRAPRPCAIETIADTCTRDICERAYDDVAGVLVAAHVRRYVLEAVRHAVAERVVLSTRGIERSRKVATL